MLVSMTGFGRAEGTFGEKVLLVELRSLNSKYSDVRLKLPPIYRSKEPDIRKMISKQMERGKVDAIIEVSSEWGEDGYSLNKALFKKYYSELREVCETLGDKNGDLVQAIMRIPSVVTETPESLKGEEWEVLKKTIQKALEDMHQHRLAEGEAMEKECRKRIASIKQLLQEIAPMEGDREERMRQRLLQHLEKFMQRENVDKNRYEQEVLHYLEKIDITEEKVRLKQHCDYFEKEVAADYMAKGKKLNFIAQEIGREINTLGSKANYSGIQHLVVRMKDDLEKIKEIVANLV